MAFAILVVKKSAAHYYFAYFDSLQSLWEIRKLPVNYARCILRCQKLQKLHLTYRHNVLISFFLI